ncbi:MAG: phosphate acyltransferase PlsX [Syntrophomonadaceae bacterium]|nr:phosphate acyltransferase PlsX [Syntrophomonadaceae bacterium]MDD3890021.1 phosphate acyltransferase PlsX [Syntrophomonadaceae bacterium]MDD4548151.1 phosphate acyltransferase PlsX [Syntrophomonadaceae bacterium]
MKIAIDAMGGDFAPGEIIAGAIKWIKENEGQLILVGLEEQIQAELSKYNYNFSQVNIVPASEVIGMDESPATAIRRKKNSSIVVATKLVKEQVADAVISCGSTGAQMAAALFILGRMEGIERPPIVAAIPNAEGKISLLIDVGANVDCKPRQLLQFARLGKVYASMVMGIDNPRVALLNNGEEETKGNNLSLEAYALLKDQTDLNFIGNIEGRELFNNASDVIVCDGFTGNILLKTVEGMAFFMARSITAELGRTPDTFNKFDYTKTGGAPLLGINGISIVCHGSSKRDAVFNAIKIAQDCFNKNIVKSQQNELVKTLQ